MGLTREGQQLAYAREKQSWKSEGCWDHKEQGLCFGPSNKLVLPENLKLSLLTTMPELNRWSPEK